MRLVTPFDPWKSRMCTCPEKYSFNPYTGCDHRCRYCYSTYIPNFFNARPKKMLLQRLERELRSIEGNSIISMSNSSDPYPPMERELGITRDAIKIIGRRNLRLLVITKSDGVLRDSDLLKEMRSAVAITITTFNPEIFEKAEPFAPDPRERLKALKKLKKEGIPVILRLDPVMPGLNDGEVEEVIEKASFVDHIVSSTLKLRHDSYSRMVNAFPELRDLYKKIYFKEGERIQGSFYLRRGLRMEILERIAEKCRELGISYGFCREGIGFDAESCDGSHLTLTSERR